MRTIDLNCDMGELPELITSGAQEALLRYVTSANVACGGHAGDEETMRATIEQALQYGVAIGAHPSYADRENFGRVSLELPEGEISHLVYEQVCALDAVAKAAGARVTHVKPHGALYNDAVGNAAIARAVAEGVARFSYDVILVGLAGSTMLEVFRDAGFAVAAEAFVDRRYEPDGSLRARRHADALIHSPAEAARQALEIVERGRIKASDDSWIAVSAETLSVHGDTPGALDIARAVREVLEQAGVSLAPLTGAI
jgi:UPF0271 protein